MKSKMVAASLAVIVLVACSPRGPSERPASSEAASEAAVSSLAPADYTSLATVMTCDWPVKKTDTAESLLATYKSYAKVTDIPGAEGITQKGVVLYGNDPRRRVVVLFHDDAMTEIKSVQISDDSQWSGAKGLHVGSTLTDVVAANEKPFKMEWSDRYYFGYPELKHGKLAHLHGGCQLDLRVEVPGKATPLPPEVLLPSPVLDTHIVDVANPELANVPLVVTVMSVSWPKSNAVSEEDDVQ